MLRNHHEIKFCFILSPNTLGLQSGTIQPTSGGTAPTKATRPKSFYQWSVVDVQKWLRRHCGDYYHLYSEAFLEQDITGRTINYNYIQGMHQL